MTAAPWFPFYIADYQADTMHLTRDQHGAYFLLMMAYYRRERGLPDDDTYLAGVAKATKHEWKRLRPVMAEFFTVKDGIWWHKRIETEIAQLETRKNFQRKAGKAGARSRWGNSTKSTPDPMAEAMAPLCPQPQSHSQSFQPANIETHYSAHAREAGKAGWLADSKISDEWIAEAAAERKAASLPVVDLVAEAAKACERWRHDPPRNPHRAWLGYAMAARPEGVANGSDGPTGPPPSIEEARRILAERETRH